MKKVVIVPAVIIALRLFHYLPRVPYISDYSSVRAFLLSDSNSLDTIKKAHKGDIEKQSFLAYDMYTYDKNYSRAEYWYLKIITHNRSEFPNDYDGELNWFKVVDAHNSLGDMYADVAEMRNYGKAVHHWTIAAENGDYRAQYRLGLAYVNGDFGLMRNVNQGVRLLMLSAQNYIPAQEALKSLGIGR